MVIAIFAALAAASAPVTVEIVASGHVETPADRYRISASLLACADTQTAADAELARKRGAVERSMAAMRVTSATPVAAVSLSGMMGALMSARTGSECAKGIEEILADSENPPKEKPAAQVGATASLSFDAPDPATAARAIAALKAADAKPSDKALPVLLDDGPAKRAAKQQALTKARAEADAYAGPLGLGAATLTAISERQDIGSVDFLGQMIRTIGLPGVSPSDKVVTDVTLTVTFRLDGR